MLLFQWAQRQRVVLLFLSAVMAFSLAIEIPGIFWLHGLGPKPEWSFNIDDNRFILAARDFGSVSTILNGYPFFQAAQLFLMGQAVERATGASLDYSVLLRSLSLLYGQIALVLTYALGRQLGLSRAAGLLGAFFLAAAPLFVVLANQGSADATALTAFYLAALSGVQAKKTQSFFWFFAACFFAGWAMAVKFLLPVLAVPALLILSTPRGRVVEHGVVAACVVLASFYASTLFSYTITDLRHLMRMLVYDNVSVSGGTPPYFQLPLYLAEIVSASGVVVALLSLPSIAILARASIRRSAYDADLGHIELLKRLVARSEALIAIPLLLHLGLITIAQVHFTRHVLLFLPIVCLGAATSVEALMNAITRRSGAAEFAGRACLALLCAGIGLNAWLTAEQYARDPRADLATLLASGAADATAFHFYSNVQGARLEEGLPTSRHFVTCDLEYQRYLNASDGAEIFHAWGGKQRLDFYNRLFAGRTDYRIAVRFRRPALSLEQRLERSGLLLPVETFVAKECVLFKHS